MNSAFYVFASAFAVSALAGLAALLRSDKELSRKNVAAHVLNSGIMGLGLSLLWYVKFQENLYFLIGLCVVAGLGGMTTVDLVVEAGHKFLNKLLGDKK